MTRVIVEPFFEKTSLKTNSEAASSLSQEEWMNTFHVEFFETNELSEASRCHLSTKCSNLTKVEFDKSNDFSDHIEKFLVSIESLDPPIRAHPHKESASGPIKKFINSISSSYSASFFEDKTSGDVKVWAILNGRFSDCLASKKPRIRISKFLQRQLRLFEVNPKVLVKASLMTGQLEENLFPSSRKKSIKLKTNYSKNVSLILIIL